MNLSRATLIALAGLCALTLTGCSSTKVDRDGRWVGGATTMTSWADSHVPSAWDRVDQSVRYEDIIDDFDNDTKKDRTIFSASYWNVSEREFELFGANELKSGPKLECEPYDVATSRPDETPYLKQCFLSLYQGQRPLPREFDLFATWTGYPDGTTTIDLHLTNDPD